MQISEILSVEHIECAFDANSKKSVLEKTSSMLSMANQELNQADIFNSLLQRERLGSTGLGRGIAIPHTRMENNKRTVATFLQLKTGVDYDSPDGVPVDLFFCLLVPEESTEQHLQILAKLADMFRDEKLIQSLRTAKTKESIYQILTG